MIDTIDTLPFLPWSLQSYNNKLYVGTDNGTLLVIIDKSIVDIIQVCNEKGSTLITSIIFDDYGFMTPVCFRSDILNLYYANGTFTGMNLRSPSLLTSSNFDASGRFIFTSLYQISVFY